MSDTIPQSVPNGCRKYVKSRIIINTFNTFKNVPINMVIPMTTGMIESINNLGKYLNATEQMELMLGWSKTKKWMFFH